MPRMGIIGIIGMVPTKGIRLLLERGLLGMSS
jgi:hypothetical protein